MTESLNVRDPRGTRRKSVQGPLSERVQDLAHKDVWLIRSWAACSGMEPLLDALEHALLQRFPGVRVRHCAKPTAYSVEDTSFFKEVAANADAFFYAGAFSASTTHYAVHYGAVLERMGVPGVVIAYDTLIEDAQNSAATAASPVRWQPVPFPLDALPLDELNPIALQLVETLCAPRNPHEMSTRETAQQPPPRFTAVQGDDVQEHYHANGFTDGLPVVPPTMELVRRMLLGTSMSPATVVAASVGPEGWEATVEQVAINAVMAGCTPASFPVVLAALEAYTTGIPGNPSVYVTHARSTSNFAHMQVVNGPIADAIGMNGGLNALGPGNRANATIGRALRLLIVNLGGGRIGVNMMPVIGNPAAYTFAFAENSNQSPWPSLAETRGFSKNDNVLTLFGGGWSHTGNYLGTGLDRLAADVSSFEFPNGLAVLVSPGRAKELFESGWSRGKIEDHIWRHARCPMKDFRSTPYWPTLIEPNLRMEPSLRQWPVEYLTLPDDAWVSIYPRDKIKVIVVGGDVSPMMQAWKTQMGPSISIDKWM